MDFLLFRGFCDLMYERVKWVSVKCWGLTISFLFLLILFWAEKSIHHEVAPKVKTAFQFYKELFTFRFTPQKTADKCWTTCFFPYISILLRCGTQFRSIYRLVLCKIGITASKFEIIDLFLIFTLTNLRTDLNLCLYFKLL